MNSIDEKDKKGRFMIISGYTVIESDIRTFSEAVRKLRGLDWIAPAPVLVKVICNAKEV